MANIDYDNKTFVAKRFLGKTQTAQSVRVSVRNEIADVVSVGVDNVVSGYDISGKEITFYGKTTVKLLYSDGTSLQSANFGADFASSVTTERLGSGDKIVFEVTTVDTNVETNANTATINILSEVRAYGYVSDNTTYVVGGEDVFVKTDKVEAMTYANVLRIPFTVDRELTSSATISSVLLAESRLEVTDYSVSDGVLTVSGNGVGRLTYMSEGNLVVDNFPFGWTRELDAPDINAEQQLNFAATIKATKVRLDISDEGGNTAFSLEMQAEMQIEATVVQPVDIVTDLYSTTCDYIAERATVETTLPCGSTHEERKLGFSADDGLVGAVNVGATVTACKGGDKTVTVEGYVTATLLYKADGEVGFRGETKELPFAETFDVPYMSPDCTCGASVAVGEVVAERGNGLRVQLWADIVGGKNVSFGVISSVEEKPYDNSERAAIEVCLAKKGDTLWNLAKTLHMSEADLVANNPTLTTPLEEDTRVVIFNRI